MVHGGVVLVLLRLVSTTKYQPTLCCALELRKPGAILIQILETYNRFPYLTLYSITLPRQDPMCMGLEEEKTSSLLVLGNGNGVFFERG